MCGLIALGVIFSFRTKNGTVTVEVADAAKDDVQLVIKSGGEQIDVADAASGWTLRLSEGQYDLELRGGQDRVQLEDRKSTRLNSSHRL